MKNIYLGIITALCFISCKNNSNLPSINESARNEEEYKYIRKYFGDKAKIYHRNGIESNTWSVVDSNKDLYFVEAGYLYNNSISNISKQIEIK